MLSTVPNWILWALKWPVAILALLLTPCVAHTAMQRLIIAHPELEGFALGWVDISFAGGLSSSAVFGFFLFTGRARVHSCNLCLAHPTLGYRFPATWNDGARSPMRDVGTGSLRSPLLVPHAPRADPM